jgi:hypothetical protein
MWYVPCFAMAALCASGQYEIGNLSRATVLLLVICK